MIQIAVILDLAMLALIVIASLALIFTETEYAYFMIFIMFVYLYYFLNYRFGVYFGKRAKLVIRKLPARDPQTAKAIFIQGVEKKKQEKSMMRQGNEKDTSFASYLNRSRRVNDSLSRSNISRSRTQLGDFSFLKNKDEGDSPLLDSFVNKDKGLNDSFTRNAKRREQREEQVSQKLKQLMFQCSKNYQETLMKMGIDPRRDKQSINSIRNLCLQLTREIYEENLNNIKNIIEALQQLYQVRVICREIPEVDRQVSRSNDWKMEIDLTDALTKLAKGKLNLPIRAVRNQPIAQTIKIGQTQPQIMNNNVKMAKDYSSKLQKLQKQRQRLNSLFNSHNTRNWDSEKILQTLQTLKQYIEQQEQLVGSEYMPSQDKLTDEQSQRLLVGFNVSRNRINELIWNSDYQLDFKTRCFMGWLKLGNWMYEIKETLNSDYGHPHYDLTVNKEKKEEFCCKYGRNNGYSLLWMYLIQLKNKDLLKVRGNRKMEQIYSKYLGINIL